MAIRATAAQVREWIKVQWQSKPIVKKEDVDGVVVEDVIEFTEARIKGLNDEVPCQENLYAIDHLVSARGWLAQRDKKRAAQGVEGTTQPHRSGGLG